MAFAASSTRSRQRSILRARTSHRAFAAVKNLVVFTAPGLSLEMVNRQTPAANQSREMFEELAVPLFDSLFNFAHWLTHNREEAEDLVQETYAKALKGF